MSLWDIDSRYRPKRNYFRKKKYGGWYKTKRGHYVRSKGERELANYLADHHEYYRYEKKIYCGRKILKPDFFLPNRGKKGVYVEYQGMSGIRSGRVHYAMKNQIYKQNHVPVVNLYPSQRGHLGRSLMSKIRRFFY